MVIILKFSIVSVIKVYFRCFGVGVVGRMFVVSILVVVCSVKYLIVVVLV